MTFAVYILTLSFSSGLVGIFARQVLAEHGYVPGFWPGIMLAAGVGAAYAATQVGFIALLRLFWPPKNSAPMAPEWISHLTVLILVPYLAHVEVHWPHPALYKVEPLVYVALFGVPHTLLKFLTIFSFLRSKPGPRWPAIWWLGVTGAASLVGYVSLTRWVGAVEFARPKAPAEVAPYRVGDAYASARVAPEGSEVACTLGGGAGKSVSLRWANPPDAGRDIITKIFVTVEFLGDKRETYTSSIALRDGVWETMVVPAAHVPKDAKFCTVVWHTQEEPKWQSVARLRPAVLSGRELLMSGPWEHATRGEKTPPNVVIVAIDQLSAFDVTGVGTKHETTPALARWAGKAATFTQAYTPAPESAAACMSILTGLMPLRHGYLGEHMGPLAARYKTIEEVAHSAGYATGAFTEGDRFNDLVHSSGFERGVEVFDSAGPEEESAAGAAKPVFTGLMKVEGLQVTAEPAVVESTGSESTLQRALLWMKAQQGTPFCAFVRVSELRGVKMRERYRFTKADPTARGGYDAALAYVDRQVTAFLAHLPDSAGTNTVVVVTSTGGPQVSDTSATSLAPMLGEEALHVPLFIAGPGIEPGPRKQLVTLCDIAPTLAHIVGVKMGSAVADTNLLEETTDAEPISVAGNPLAMTVRNDHWRLYWITGQGPFATGESQAETVVLHDLSHWKRGAGLADLTGRYKDLTAKWVKQLRDMRDSQNQEWREK